MRGAEWTGEQGIMEAGDDDASLIQDGRIRSIKLSLSTDEEISKYSSNTVSITNHNQLGNSFLGLPLAVGKCDSCGTAEVDKCEGHFGYIELPVAVYHPSHISELRLMLSLLCLKCLRVKKATVKRTNGRDSVSPANCYYCKDSPAVTIKEKVSSEDGAISLELRASARKRVPIDFWKFLERYHFPHYGYSEIRPLLPLEALKILNALPEESIRKLTSKGFIPQKGYILKLLSVPPNCLRVPEFFDGDTVMACDISSTYLRKVLSKIEQIKKSRSGDPTFESHVEESIVLQSAIRQYYLHRGTTKGPQDHRKAALGMGANGQSSKQWLEKMKTLFISKGSGFCSRGVITGDSYIGLNVIGLPSEIAKQITFEEQVTEHNLKHLQDLVDKGLCLEYRDGPITYAISVGSKGHTNLKVGQTIKRRIVDGDIVFLNRPPSTHKHSLQAFYVYVHEDHTIKINPLICQPLGADFDGDCVHIYYPQSLAAKAEALELFSVEKQIISSHSGSLNLQLVHDSLLGLKVLSSRFFLKRSTASQLAMFMHALLPSPAIYKAENSEPYWTITQIIQNAFPAAFSCPGKRYHISGKEILVFELERDFIQGALGDVMSSLLRNHGSKEAVKVLNLLQPLLMEILQMDGFSVSLKDFDIPAADLRLIQAEVQKQSYLLKQSRSLPNQFLELRVESKLKSIRANQNVEGFVVKDSSIGYLIDAKSDSAHFKVVQQIGFVGLQLYRFGRFYSTDLVEDCFLNYVNKYSTHGISHPSEAPHPSEAYGLISGSFFHGLNPYEELVHSISTREAIVRSSRGLTEPGSLFKNLMAVMRDVVICYDSSVRNICSNSIIQFEYGVPDMTDSSHLSPPGEPVGVLAATAISTPAYKAVLDSSLSNNTSWDLMKEILLTRTAFKNDLKDRKVILFLSNCFCGKKNCKERAALVVQGFLKKVKLVDCATYFAIEYQNQTTACENDETGPSLVGHIHLDEIHLKKVGKTMDEILQKCQEIISKHGKKRKQHASDMFKRLNLTSSICCSFEGKPKDGKSSGMPCLQFSFSEENGIPNFESFDKAVDALGHVVLPILLDTIIKGDPRVQDAKIVWIEPDAASWVENSRKVQKGEPALEVVIEKDAAPKNGDAWRTTMDACIPVLNLINTRRSIPSSIQQIRELLGISCAFDQVVQRLSSSMKAVSKGLLKDHLILVANSMTCTGSLHGFNTAGYKAMFRSLKVQAPFAESTLYTPLKCFERAAEKCYEDSLKCVVSSTAWGKHASIGTGSSFQILYSENKFENKDFENGLYDFIANVRSVGGKGGKASAGSFLDDVDYLQEENEFGCMSPELDDGSVRPTFDDDVDNNLPNGSSRDSIDSGAWGQQPAAGGDSGNWGGWDDGAVSKKASTPGDEWPTGSRNGEASCWGKPRAGNEDVDKWGGWETVEPTKATAGVPEPNWTKEKTVDSDHSWGKQPSSNRKSSAWEEPVPDKIDPENRELADAWDTPKISSTSEPAAWTSGNKDTANVNSSWDSGRQNNSSWGEPVPDKIEPENRELSDAWDKPSSTSARAAWTSGNNDTANVNSSWDSRRQDNSSWDGGEKQSNSWNCNGQNTKGSSNPWNAVASTWDNADGPSAQKKQKERANDSEAWGKNNVELDDWNNKVNENQDPWASRSEGQANGWDGKANKEPEQRESSSGWSNSWTGKDNKAQGDAEIGTDDGWGGKANQIREQKESSPGWDSWTDKGKAQGDAETGTAGGWGNSNANENGTDNAWREVRNSDNGRSDGWRSRSDSGRGRGRGRGRNNFGRPPLNPDDQGSGWNPGTPRPRPEPLFTPEEREILVDIEPIVQRVKTIVREASDGIRLSEEDQKFIVDNVLEHYPEKQFKIEGNIDYVMVAKHKKFADTRCLHTVSKDGTIRDFSYHKCLESFVMKKFPEHGESFSSKYFRRPEPLFTPEEREILVDLEPIVQRVKTIVREASDGIRISEEAQKFIVENVLDHHPSIQSKIEGELDYLMVAQHEKFPDTRCLHTVSKDGTIRDFSYLKCLESFVMKKFPEHGESFSNKYFRRSRRNRSPSPAPSMPAATDTAAPLDPIPEDPREGEPPPATPDVIQLE